MGPPPTRRGRARRACNQSRQYEGDRRMGLSVALFATIALAASAVAPQDATGWRAQAETLFTQGNFRGSLEAAERARTLDPSDPWARYAWIRALAAVDAEAARLALPGLQDPEALKAFPEEDRARLQTAFGYLCLDLGIEPLAAHLLRRGSGDDPELSPGAGGPRDPRRPARQFATGARALRGGARHDSPGSRRLRSSSVTRATRSCCGSS